MIGPRRKLPQRAADAAGQGHAPGAASVPHCSGERAPLRAASGAPAASRADAPQLWLAVHLPGLALEALGSAAGSAAPARPRAATELGGRVQRIIVADERASAAGVRPGLALTAALALLPELDAQPRDARRERLLLERLAAHSLRFTPRVSLEPPDALLLEVRGSLGLFGGARALGRALASDCAALGARPKLALAPTPLAALAGARSGAGFIVRHPAQLVGHLAALPLAALRWPERTLARLAAMGVRTIGQALRLPRAGFARRFGAAELESLDRLIGRSAEPRRAFLAGERFHGRFEPACELVDHAALLAVLEPLLADLERFLQERQCGITALFCRLRHRHAPPAACALRLVQPALEAQHLLALLRERLATIVLPEPVVRCELRSGPLVPARLESETLWQPGEHGGPAGSEAPAFIEQLRARLGFEAIHGLELVPEHRPEEAWRVAAAAAAAQQALPWQPFRRPTWLLREPQPLEMRGGRPWHRGALRLLDGPERIETGWWDGRDVRRDYYIARDAQGATLWIYRERSPPHAWFLHGLFG